MKSFFKKRKKMQKLKKSVKDLKKQKGYKKVSISTNHIFLDFSVILKMNKSKKLKKHNKQ